MIMMGKATKDLKNEHSAIIHVLKILDKIMANHTKADLVKLQYYKELVDFLKIFADKCHHGKEENFLFEALISKGILNQGGPIGVMLEEHIEGREYIALMSRALEAANIAEFTPAAIGYRDLLRKHIDKENNVLFVMADQLLDEKSQDELFEKFERHEESVIGHGVHEELHAKINKWATDFEVH